MTKPNAIDAQEGYKYQLLTRYRPRGLEWEHCNYATDDADLKHLRENYRLAYGAEFDFKVITQPRRLWPNLDPATLDGKPYKEAARLLWRAGYRKPVSPRGRANVRGDVIVLRLDADLIVRHAAGAPTRAQEGSITE